MATVTRRQLCRLATGAAVAGALAGCLGSDGGDGDDGSGNGDNDDDATRDVPTRIHNHLRRAQGYEEEMVDRRGESTVEIDVGAGTGGVAFGPPAVRVDAGTQIRWVWTGRGSVHDVSSVGASDFSFASERAREDGHEFTQTFEDGGIALYECRPHRSQGMLGAVEALLADEDGSGDGD